LPENAFQAYKLKQQAAGAELEHLKPPHINPADDTINFLLNTPARVAVSEPEKVEA
jgi:hypothetical protein